MNGVTIRQLRYYDALVRAEHFGRAAENCSVSQPALSNSIKELEANLDVQLVERGGRQIRFTSIGQTIAARSRDIVRAVDNLTELTRGAHRFLGGQFNVGAIPTIAPYFLPEAIRVLSSWFPQMQVKPIESTTEKLLEKVINGKLDAAIVASPVDRELLASFQLLEEGFALVRPSAMATEPVPPISELPNQGLMVMEEGHCVRDQVLSLCSSRQLGASNLVQGSSLGTLVQLVGSGLGCTIVPEMAIRLETVSADVSVEKLPRSVGTRTVTLVWRESNPTGDSVEKIGQVIRASIR